MITQPEMVRIERINSLIFSSGAIVRSKNPTMYYYSSRLGIVFVHSSGMTCTRASHNLTAHKIVALFLSNLLIKSSRVGAGHFTKEKTCKKLLYVILDNVLQRPNLNP